MENQSSQPQDTEVAKAVEGEYHSNMDLVEIEKERIKSVRLAIETNDAADQRLFDYHMSRLESNSKLKLEQIKIAKTLTYGASISAFIFLSVLIWMAFFGNENQAKTATYLFETLIKGLAGIASYIMAKGLFNKLTAKIQE